MSRRRGRLLHSIVCRAADLIRRGAAGVGGLGSWVTTRAAGAAAEVAAARQRCCGGAGGTVAPFGSARPPRRAPVAFLPAAAGTSRSPLTRHP